MSLLDKFRSLEASFWAKIDLIRSQEFKDKWILYMQDRIVGVFDNKEKIIQYLQQMKEESRDVIPEVALCVKMGGVPRFHRIMLNALCDSGRRCALE